MNATNTRNQSMMTASEALKLALAARRDDLCPVCERALCTDPTCPRLLAQWATDQYDRAGQRED